MLQDLPFFRAQAFGEALRKDRDGSAEKGTMKRGQASLSSIEKHYQVVKKGKRQGRGQAAAQEKRSPLPPRHETCTRSPRTSTQICGKFETRDSKDFAEGREKHNRKRMR